MLFTGAWALLKVAFDHVTTQGPTTAAMPHVHDSFMESPFRGHFNANYVPKYTEVEQIQPHQRPAAIVRSRAT
ncbi:hypothetical protein K438DRAFT_1854977, partial [Mycena galopus ATCC 62051]